MQALPVNTNKPASVSEDPRRLPPSPKRSSSLFRRRAALPVHNHMGRGQNMGGKHVWKCDFNRLNVDDRFISSHASLSLQLQPRWLSSHTEQPTFTFYISQPVGLICPSHTVWWCYDCGLTHTHAHTLSALRSSAAQGRT